MKEQFIEKNFRGQSLALIETANNIIHEYSADGLMLTLRQLYYQFVARGLIENTEKSYKNLGSLISDGRLAGLIDWNAIEDRTRNLEGEQHWNSPGDIIEAVARSYHIDKWQQQDHRVEVWVEKEALVGVIEQVCRKWDVSFFACRGYVSQSESYKAGKRFEQYIEDGITPVILHLGDHDPSGIDMTRDNRERSWLFALSENVDLHRIALNMDQIQKYNPPPNPAKMSDARAADYVRKFGKKSWELDALEPKVLIKLVETHIKKYVDMPLFEERCEQQDQERELLVKVSDRWDSVADYVS